MTHLSVLMIIVPLIVFGGMYYTLYQDYTQLQESNMELEQHYEWALEMSKLTPEDRKDITTIVKSQLFV